MSANPSTLLTPAQPPHPGGGWTLAAYQQAALQTALPTAHALEYLAPGLVSEIGELAGVLAKEHRDSTGPNYYDRMCELGDVAWVTAVWLHDLGIDDPYSSTNSHLGVLTEHLRKNEVSAETAVLVILPGIIEPLVSFTCRYRENDLPTTPEGLPHDAAYESIARTVLLSLWRALAFYAPHLAAPGGDDPFSEALGLNVAKLQSRQTRGTIGGSGDHR
jgi:NTP pyrophosphatase (non-canonical NTP hydrolase)